VIPDGTLYLKKGMKSGRKSKNVGFWEPYTVNQKISILIEISKVMWPNSFACRQVNN
jgi:hypothetical protein